MFLAFYVCVHSNIYVELRIECCTDTDKLQVKEKYMNNSPVPPKTKPHSLNLSGRNRLSISGVEEVISFDDMTVALHTSEGDLTVEGEGLHIVKLNLDSGEVDVTGNVSAMIYTEQKTATRGGFFSGFRK